MIAPRLVMILASAGSGKTFRLTNRFIALLAAGAAPERIVALTFTRKAAGEFFDGILGKLASAAEDVEAAGKLAREIGRPELGPEDFRRLLRAMADALHRLRLGTLDSFFAQIARAFPFELGLAGDFTVLEDHAARVERRRVLHLLFARAGGELADEQRDFLEAFKRATFGTEEKQLARKLDGFLDDYYSTYLEAPAAELWGRAERIWSGRQPWLEPVQAGTVAASLRRWLGGAAMEEKQRERWLRLGVELEEWSVGAVWGKEVNYFLPKLLEAFAALQAGAAELTIERRKQTLDAAGCAVAVDIVRLVAGGELRRRLEATQGIHAVLAHYDALYDALVRRAGRLGFADVERLLRPDAGARALSFGGAEDGRLALDYRLDAGIDHWLLDEFQDTSRGQWSVLQNLIDEVVQDADERRTFFCVGDEKQSIYGWREGDPTLMGDIRRHYNGDDNAEGPIATEPLDASWRSGPAVIGLVNAVFGADEAIRGLFPGEGGTRWNKAWRAHTTERHDRRGHAALLFAADAEDRARQTLRLLQEIAPLERGLTCAVLVRRNDEATALADFLRREGGLAAVAESDLAVCTDHPAGAAVLALVQAAAHPGDTLAWEHVQMTPLGDALGAAGLARRDAVTRAVLAQISEEGFERFAEHWLARLPAGGAFTQERARQFAAAAALFDAGGRRDPDEFVQFMTGYRLREPESAAVVRVMTIHKSKGLGFDVVILPELQGTKLDAAREGLAVRRGDGHAPEWVLQLPPATVAREDAVLGNYLEASAQDACYEALSLLYVAMTRAKHAMYAVIEAPKANSSSNNYPKLLTEALGAEPRPVRVGAQEFSGAWSAGEADWHRGIAGPAAAEVAGGLPVVAVPAVARRVARRAAERGAEEFGAAGLFALRETAARSFGAAVHALLAEVEWGAEDEIAARVAAWRARGEPEAVVAHAAGVLRAPELRAVWLPPEGKARAEAWRERAFEIVLEGAWISGVFDRVVVARGPDGAARAATVFDFKTEAVSGDAAGLAAAAGKHAPQLRLYRRVVARLTGLPESGVGAEVVFTAAGRRCPVALTD